MTSIGKKISKLIKNRKVLLIIVTLLLLIVSVRVGYAYYYQNKSINIIASTIGDFDIPLSDINILVYKQTSEDDFQRVYTVPAVGYEFDDTKTKCTQECHNDGTGDCHYIYDASNRKFDLTSNKKVTCKFYFTEKEPSDIDVFIYIQDEDGDVDNNGKTYKLSDYIPAYGYKYSNSECKNGGTVEYNSSTRKISVSTTKKESCNVYFDSNGDADIIVNVFVQTEKNGNLYRQVNSIPDNYIFELSSKKDSWCYENDNPNTVVGAGISYVDGYISITAERRETCNVYLDIKSDS